MGKDYPSNSPTIPGTAGKRRVNLPLILTAGLRNLRFPAARSAHQLRHRAHQFPGLNALHQSRRHARNNCHSALRLAPIQAPPRPRPAFVSNYRPASAVVRAPIHPRDASSTFTPLNIDSSRNSLIQSPRRRLHPHLFNLAPAAASAPHPAKQTSPSTPPSNSQQKAQTAPPPAPAQNPA